MIGKKGHERARDFAFIVQLENERRNEKQVMEALLNEYSEFNKVNDNTVQKNLSLQSQALKERVLKRSMLKSFEHIINYLLNLQKPSISKRNL